MKALKSPVTRNNYTGNEPTQSEMDTRLSTKLMACLLSFLLIYQPMLVSAQVIIADKQSQKNHSANGVPIINIATPSSKGVSHNKFQRFDVDQKGLILNNAGNITNTQLAGYIDANPNLQNGSSANLIINEVLGPDRSMLNGYTEVAGQAAGIVVANPNGISCNGCGFINTPRVSLATGKPTIQNGELTGLTVNGGDIITEGEGLNAGNISQFDIITRAVKVNADLHARDLNLILGSNQVNYASLEATAIHPDSDVEFALDSSVLGGMYTNAIRLVGTEAGVGVQMLGNVATNAGELHLSTDGKISINKVQSAGPITLHSVSSSIELNQDVRSNKTIDLQAKETITNKGLTTAADNITLRANTLNQQGSASGVTVEDGEYKVSRDGSLDLVLTGKLINSGRILSGGNIDI